MFGGPEAITGNTIPMKFFEFSRTNAQTKSIEREFIQQGIRYDVVNGMRFFDRREVRDMLSFMKCLLTPVQEDMALERVINVPPRRIGATTILRLKNASKTLKLPLWSIIEHVALRDQVEKEEDQVDNLSNHGGSKALAMPNLHIKGQQLEGYSGDRNEIFVLLRH